MQVWPNLSYKFLCTFSFLAHTVYQRQQYNSEITTKKPYLGKHKSTYKIKQIAHNITEIHRKIG